MKLQFQPSNIASVSNNGKRSGSNQATTLAALRDLFSVSIEVVPHSLKPNEHIAKIAGQHNLNVDLGGVTGEAQRASLIYDALKAKADQADPSVETFFKRH